MRGIRYLVDESGESTAVVIDLSTHGELWEDFYDRCLAEERADEPRESLDDVARRLGLWRLGLPLNATPTSRGRVWPAG